MYSNYLNTLAWIYAYIIYDYGISSRDGRKHLICQQTRMKYRWLSLCPSVRLSFKMRARMSIRGHVRPSVRWSVGWSVGWSVTLSSKSMKNGLLWILSGWDSAGRGRKRNREEGGTRRNEEEGATRRKERRGGRSDEESKKMKKL